MEKEMQRGGQLRGGGSPQTLWGGAIMAEGPDLPGNCTRECSGRVQSRRQPISGGRGHPWCARAAVLDSLRAG